METTSTMGKNRTGIQTSPKVTRDMIESSIQEAAPPPGDESALAAFRRALSADAEMLGSVPPPTTVKGVAKAGLKMMTGKRPQALLDKVGERLAFERTGVRLYEALIAKHQLKASELTNVPIDRLEQIRSDELGHFAMLMEAMDTLGGDPTAQTPCADVVGVEAMGPLQVITDARTTFAQALNAILVIELADNAGWDLLIDLAELEGHAELAQRFRSALTTEESHLDQVRAWLRELLRADAQIGGSLMS